MATTTLSDTEFEKTIHDTFETPCRVHVRLAENLPLGWGHSAKVVIGEESPGENITLMVSYCGDDEEGYPWMVLGSKPGFVYRGRTLRDALDEARNAQIRERDRFNNDILKLQTATPKLSPERFVADIREVLTDPRVGVEINHAGKDYIIGVVTLLDVDNILLVDRFIDDGWRIDHQRFGESFSEALDIYEEYLNRTAKQSKNLVDTVNKAKGTP